MVTENVFLFFLCLHQFYYACLAAEAGNESTTGSSDGLQTVKTTERLILKEYMPESDLYDSLHLEVGDYSTVSYSYFNDQYLGWYKPAYKCYDDYIRCTLARTFLMPICALHYVNNNYGYKNLPSMCDMFWYNCRRGYRYFFVAMERTCGFKIDNNERNSVILWQQGK